MLEWSKTITCSDHIVDTREKISDILLKNGITPSGQILLITALSEICRVFLTSVKEFQLIIKPDNRKLIFKLTTKNPPFPSDPSKNPVPDIDLDRFNSIFDEIDLRTGNQSKPTFTIEFTKLINL